ncbi:Hsp70 family protein [Amycolatopsis sp. VC5-11]|uniref:Hsp70 family protein n=1 Tax=Amycolatopsis sp. VC5-11 TaxID=3120156 RepID=UPI00300B7542
MTGNATGKAVRRCRVVAAIDFGTYATGFAWTVVSELHESPENRQIYSHTQWPAAPVPYPKTRTCLLLDRDGNVVTWGHDAYCRWQELRASNRAAGMRLVQGFKMSLAEAAEDTDDLPSLALNDDEPLPGELITQYLSEVYEIAVAEIGKRGFTPDDIRWCLTVPAIWDDYQKQVMRLAAEAAGLPAEEGRLMLAYEPEAAAHYARVAGVSVLGVDGVTGPSLMAPGARFIVADCGGGTVDTTAYRSEEDGKMVEIGRVSGNKAGSYYLNRAFERRILVPRLGGPAEYQRLKHECPSAIEELLDGWERSKLTVDMERNHPIYLALPLPLFRRLSAEAVEQLPQLQDDGIGDSIVVSATDIREIFESVVPTILDLVDRQLDEIRRQTDHSDRKELVLLVGGFGASPYLQQRLARHLADRATVLCVPEPSEAVLRGAVHFAYDPHTRMRRSKHTYAIGRSIKFDPELDRGRPSTISWEGEKLCVDRVKVLVRAGDPIPSNHAVTTVAEPVHKDQRFVVTPIYRTLDRDPRYSTDAGCVKVGEIVTDLDDTMQLHIRDRRTKTKLSFGETEISAVVTLLSTKEQQDATLEFHAL